MGPVLDHTAGEWQAIGTITTTAPWWTKRDTQKKRKWPSSSFCILHTLQNLKTGCSVHRSSKCLHCHQSGNHVGQTLRLQINQAEGTCMDQELLSLPIENRGTAQQKDAVWTQRISPGQKPSSRTLRQISSSAHGEGSVCLDLGIGGLLNIVV